MIAFIDFSIQKFKYGNEPYITYLFLYVNRIPIIIYVPIIIEYNEM